MPAHGAAVLLAWGGRGQAARPHPPSWEELGSLGLAGGRCK